MLLARQVPPRLISGGRGVRLVLINGRFHGSLNLKRIGGRLKPEVAVQVSGCPRADTDDQLYASWKPHFIGIVSGPVTSGGGCVFFTAASTKDRMLSLDFQALVALHYAQSEATAASSWTRRKQDSKLATPFPPKGKHSAEPPLSKLCTQTAARSWSWLLLLRELLLQLH